MAIITRPERMIPPVMPLNGVSNFPFGFSSLRRNRMVSRASRRKVILPSALTADASVLFVMGGLLLFADLAVLVEVVQPDEQRRPQHEHQGHPVEEPGGELGIGRRRQVGLEAELLLRSAHQVEPAGPADFVLPVDLMDVLVRLVVDPGLGDLQQIPLFPEEGRAGGARLGAGGLFPLLLPLVAEDALPHEGGGAVVLELWDVEGTGDRAVAGPHAAVLVVNDRGLLGLLHRPGQAGGGARRLVAVHALLPDEDRLLRVLLVLEPVRGREGAGGGGPRLLAPALGGDGHLRLGKMVRLVAGLLAGAAADALRRVDEHPVELDAPRRGLRRPRQLGRRGAPSEQDATGRPRDLQKVPSADGHLSTSLGIRVQQLNYNQLYTVYNINS